MDYACLLRWFSMDSAWIMMVVAWVLHGLCIDSGRVTVGSCMDYTRMLFKGCKNTHAQESFIILALEAV